MAKIEDELKEDVARGLQASGVSGRLAIVLFTFCLVLLVYIFSISSRSFLGNIAYNSARIAAIEEHVDCHSNSRGTYTETRNNCHLRRVHR